MASLSLALGWATSVLQVAFSSVAQRPPWLTVSGGVRGAEAEGAGFSPQEPRSNCGTFCWSEQGPIILDPSVGSGDGGGLLFF